MIQFIISRCSVGPRNNLRGPKFQKNLLGEHTVLLRTDCSPPPHPKQKFLYETLGSNIYKVCPSAIWFHMDFACASCTLLSLNSTCTPVPYVSQIKCTSVKHHMKTLCREHWMWLSIFVPCFNQC